jgi:hypothetical protein
MVEPVLSPEDITQKIEIAPRVRLGGSTTLATSENTGIGRGVPIAQSKASYETKHQK